jgi:hypothetical protein
VKGFVALERADQSTCGASMPSVNCLNRIAFE